MHRKHQFGVTHCFQNIIQLPIFNRHYRMTSFLHLLRCNVGVQRSLFLKRSCFSSSKLLFIKAKISCNGITRLWSAIHRRLQERTIREGSAVFRQTLCYRLEFLRLGIDDGSTYALTGYQIFCVPILPAACKSCTNCKAPRRKDRTY